MLHITVSTISMETTVSGTDNFRPAPFSSVDITNSLSTKFLMIPCEKFLRKMRYCLVVQFLFPMCMVFLRTRPKAYLAYYERWHCNWNTVLEVCSREQAWKGICNRGHIASVTYPASVGESTVVKLAAIQSTFSYRIFCEGPN